MNWKEFTDDYLNFSRKDRIGITVILGVILSAFFLPEAFSKGKSLPKENSSDTSWITSMPMITVAITNTTVQPATIMEIQK